MRFSDRLAPFETIWEPMALCLGLIGHEELVTIPAIFVSRLVIPAVVQVIIRPVIIRRIVTTAATASIPVTVVTAEDATVVLRGALQETAPQYQLQQRE